jgi:hypothetical protein
METLRKQVGTVSVEKMNLQGELRRAETMLTNSQLQREELKKNCSEKENELLKKVSFLENKVFELI